MDEKKFAEKIWENFQKFSKEICEKCIILADFSNTLTTNALIFCAFGRKRQFIGNFEKIFENFWWKFYTKIEFFIFYFLFFRKFVTKNRAFGNNTIFLQQFFRFRGGPFPLATPLISPLVRNARWTGAQYWSKAYSADPTCLFWFSNWTVFKVLLFRGRMLLFWKG